MSGEVGDARKRLAESRLIEGNAAHHLCDFAWWLHFCPTSDGLGRLLDQAKADAATEERERIAKAIEDSSYGLANMSVGRHQKLLAHFAQIARGVTR